MNGIRGDIWKLAESVDGFVVVPTNTCVRKDGTAVMGAGMAKQAAEKYPSLPRMLATAMAREGIEEGVFDFPEIGIVCLPTKRDWREPSDLALIRSGCKQLAELAALAADVEFFVPCLGTGLGGLSWQRQVRPVMVAELKSSPNITVVMK